MGTPNSEILYPFYQSNIHERRWATTIVCAVPISCLLLTVGLLVFGILKSTNTLLSVCAALNVAMWFWISSTAAFAIFGARVVDELVTERPVTEEQATAASAELAERAESQDEVRHIICFPNYKEELSMLAETMQSLAEAAGSNRFWVVLAMEAREGDDGERKAAYLQASFKDYFWKVSATFHPANLSEKHQDGSSCPEVPGKASNVKWAVQEAQRGCEQDGALDVDNMILTVADADVFFHPGYFAHISGEFRRMKAVSGDEEKWAMWQAPQLCFRNYYESPVVSRVWGYIATMYEFGGVTGLLAGSHNMVFSAYSLSLRLAVDGQLWDGDVIAEDHHAYLKGFFYSAHHSACEEVKSERGCLSAVGCRPPLKVHPVMLPVKSTSVVSPDGYWQTYVERWHQATRHSQGVAELPYAILATWDMICTLPLAMWNFPLLLHLLKVITRLFFIHIIPVSQSLALATITIYWICNNRQVPGCPDRLWMAAPSGGMLLCGLAGAWVLTWPVVIPFFLLAFANYRMIRTSFMLPAERSFNLSKWHSADGGIPPTLGSKSLTLALLILWDCAVMLGPLMAVYGVVAMILAYWNVVLRGNQFKYITAAKAASGPSYGTMPDGGLKVGLGHDKSPLSPIPEMSPEPSRPSSPLDAGPEASPAAAGNAPAA